MESGQYRYDVEGKRANAATAATTIDDDNDDDVDDCNGKAEQ